MYAVVDLETTGTRTSWHDRVLEIAVVRLDETGRTVDEWCTLVNPDRDLGPQEIHGITAAEARRAPRFADLAGQVVERLAGHTVVAHNLIFDAGFLTAEFAKLGYQVPVEAGRGLCTMRLAGHFPPAAARSLQACRSAAGLGRGGQRPCPGDTSPRGRPRAALPDPIGRQAAPAAGSTGGRIP